MDFISEKIAEYLSQNSEKEPEILSKLNRETHQKVLQPRMLSGHIQGRFLSCLLYTSPSPRDRQKSRMPSSA